MNQLTIISKNYGTQTIYVESYDPWMAATNSTLFKIIEHMFNDWWDKHTEPGAPLWKDVIGCYNGWGEDEPAIFSKKGAIRGGIEMLIELAQEENLSVVTTKDILKMDIECAFEI